MPLSFEIQGQDLLKCPTAAVVVINHQSSIDLMSLFEIWPLLEHAGPIAKRELLYIQPFGLACWLCGAEGGQARGRRSGEGRGEGRPLAFSAQAAAGANRRPPR